MNENTRLILGGIGGAVLGAMGVLGLVETDQITVPPETPAISAPCPDGWADTSKEVEHAIVLSCEKDEWLVILHVDGTFSHGLQKNTPGAKFVYDPQEVDGWLE
jgi:hypothetical protein